LEDPLIGGVLLLEEVDHDHVVLLPIAMTTTNALLEALGIPRQVIIHDEGTELEVDPLRARAGRTTVSASVSVCREISAL
jgi:hypothetical protein